MTRSSYQSASARGGASILVFVCVILLLLSVWSLPVSATHPVAAFSYAPGSPTTVDTVVFTDESMEADPIVNWTWDLGDGNVSYQQNPSHRYPSSGDFTVQLTVRNSLGEPDATIQVVSVGNDPPSAAFTHAPADPSTADTITFTDTSTDTDGEVVNWTWSFGDGNTSYVQNPTHSYGAAGNHTVTLNVTDDEGGTDEVSVVLGVATQDPVAGFTFDPASPSTTDTVTFTDASSDADGTIANWTWAMGDGTTLYGASVTHRFQATGDHNVTLTVTDDDGATGSNTTTVAVRSPPGGGGGGGTTAAVGAVSFETNAWAFQGGWRASATLRSSTETLLVSFPDDAPVKRLTLGTSGIGTLAVDLSPLPGSDLAAPEGIEVTDPFDIAVVTALGLSHQPGLIEMRADPADFGDIDPKRLVALTGGEGSWVVMSSSLSDASGGLLQAHAAHFSPFAVGIDMQPPELSLNGTNEALAPGEAFTFTASDNRAIETVTATLDGAPVSLESDDGAYRFRVTEDLAPGSYALAVTAEDASGLTTTREWTIQVAGARDAPEAPRTDGNDPAALHEEANESEESPVAVLPIVAALLGLVGLLRRRR